MAYYDTLPPVLTAPVIERSPVLVGGVSGEASLYLDELKTRLSMELTVQDYDPVLTQLLGIAIDAVETYTRLALQPQTVTVRYAGYEGGPLPFGPVWSVEPSPVVTKTNTGSTITFSSSTSGTLTEGDFPTIAGSFDAGTAVYTSGYSHASGNSRPVPAGLVGAILEHAAESFRTGGLSGGKPGTYWKTLAGPKRRFD